MNTTAASYVLLSAEAAALQGTRAALAHIKGHPDHAARLADLDKRLPKAGAAPVHVDQGTETVLSDVSDFTLSGLRFEHLGNALILHRCKRFRITDVTARDLQGCAITLFDCEDFEIDGVQATGCYSSAVMCVGNTRYGRIQRVSATRGRGPRNRDAGIHLVSCTQDVVADNVPDACHEARAIIDKVKRPSFIKISRVSCRDNRAQGIYLEGAVGIEITRSTIVGNNKEGICFDWGSSFCTLSTSLIAGNGHRRQLTREDIEADFLHQVPVLADGSSAIKVPGISLDNGAFNRIERNVVCWNAGGAFKLVRACARTVIRTNLAIRNTVGNNPHHRVRWFHDAGVGDLLGEFGEDPLLDLGRSFATKRRLNAVFEH